MQNNINNLRSAFKLCPELRNMLISRGESPELPLNNMPELNKKLWGIHKKKLLVIGARTSQGKSMFAINIAYDLASQRKRVMFLSLEMPREKILERLFCLDSTVDNIILLKGGYNKNSWIREKFLKFQEKVKSWNLLIADCIGRDWKWLDEEVFSKLDNKPDVVIIDHIQEIRGGRSQKEAIDEYISKMREASIRHNFALILCSQANRASMAKDNENNEPQLHHLKASGFVEESADTVILTHWPYFYVRNTDSKIDPQEYILHVAKNRDGMTGYIKMRYIPQYYKLIDWVDKPEKDADPTTKNYQDTDWEE